MEIVFSQSDHFTIRAFDSDRQRILLNEFGNEELRAIFVAPFPSFCLERGQERKRKDQEYGEK